MKLGSIGICQLAAMSLFSWKYGKFKNNILLIYQANLFNFGSCFAFKYLITHSVTSVDKSDF